MEATPFLRYSNPMKFLMRLLSKAMGWRIQFDIPKEVKSFVLIGAPHTSNWDFVHGMAFIDKLPQRAHFAIKAEWLRFPFNLLMKPMGAIGIDRNSIQTSGKQKTTDFLASLFAKHEAFVLAITPEGTRKKCEKWKTGFYHIAKKANVPIALGFADYKKKIVGVSKIIYPYHFEKDMQAIMDFYQQVTACYPELFSLHVPSRH